MKYYAKRHDIKNDTTVIEGVYDDPDEAQKKVDELLLEEEKLPKTSCIFTVELTKENIETYREITEAVVKQIAIEEGFSTDTIDNEFIDTFKMLL